MKLKNDLAGKLFGRLTAVSLNGIDRKGSAKWLCRCQCGIQITLPRAQLITGRTRSCGCLQRDESSVRHTKHGHAREGRKSRTYVSWINMMSRCNNPSDPRYKWYGGRGIIVSGELRSFESFLAIAGECPLGATLDRYPDNNGNYDPKNIRWATHKEQMRNMSRNNLISYDGKTQCLSQWEEEKHLPPKCIYKRLKRGWTVEEAINTPKMR